MAIEIERKFLLKNDAWRAQVHESVPMAQGYLNDLALVNAGAMRASIRVRLEGEQARLNIKSRELGASRQEFEYPVPVSDANALLALCVGGLVEKTRHYLHHAGHLWEIDEFHGSNAGLVVAEIELQDENEVFAHPKWLGAEATHAPRYYNLALADRPFSAWNDAERQALDLKDDAACC
jgi:adenylate cyclase